MADNVKLPDAVETQVGYVERLLVRWWPASPPHQVVDNLRTAIADALAAERTARKAVEARKRELDAAFIAQDDEIEAERTAREAAEAQLRELDERLAAIDAACLKACPENTAELLGEPDEGIGRYLIVNENGDPLIGTDEPAEVDAGLDRLWRAVSEQVEVAEARVRELQTTVAFFASVIRSGESWSEQCQQHLDAARQAGEVDR